MPDDIRLNDLYSDHERTKVRVSILEDARRTLEQDIASIKADLAKTSSKLDSIQVSINHVVSVAMDAMPRWASEAQERKNIVLNASIALSAVFAGALAAVTVAFIYHG
jgi:hypothetical protein